MAAAAAAASSVPAAVSPPPSAGPVPHHPPYKEMIVRAIESLKEKNGSSRTAISKFIAVNYFGLPLKHEALLSTHIRRLKKNGVITTMKHSYMMTGDVSGATKRRVAAGDSSMALVVASKRRGRPPKSDLANLTSQRGRLLKPVAAGGRRGRPPKMAILADAAAAATEMTEMGDSAAAWRAGRLRKAPPVRLIFPNGLKLGPASMLATLSSKRQKPGRPRKGLGGVSTGPLLKKQKLGRLRKGLEGVSTALAVDENGLLGERRRGGRPKKVLQLGENMVSGHVDGSVGRRKPGRPAKVDNSVSGDVEGSGDKRRPGRLAKVAHLVSGDLDGFVGKRKPGRPAKIAHPVSGHGDGSVGKRKLGRSAKAAYPLSGNIEGFVGKRKPGRPSKVVHPVSGVVEGSVGKRKPGRPTKIVHPVSGDVEGSVGKKKPRRLVKIVHTLSGDVERSVGKRKPGRPAKVANSTFGNVVEAAKVAHPESGDVEGSTLKRKPGRPAKVVELEPDLGLTLVTSDGDTPIEKRKSRPSQKLLQLSFGSKNGAAGAFTRKRKRGRASVGVSFFEAMNGAAEVSSGKKKLGRLQPGSVSGAVKSSSRKKPGRQKKVVDESVDKKLSRPRKIMKQSLNSAIGSVEASAGKRKQGRPRKIVLPNLNSIYGAVKISDGNRKPRQLQKAVLPDLNLANEDVLHLKDTDQHAGAMGSVDGQMKMVLTQVSEFPDADIMFGSVAGLPKKSPNGEGDSYINNGNLVQLQKDVQTDLNGEVTKGRVVVNGGTTLMNSSQSSVGKRKLGRPKKLSQVDEDTTLLTQMQTSPGKLVGVAELAPDPVPAAVDVLLGMRNPGTAGKVSAISSAAVEDGGNAYLNPVQESADNAAEGLKLGEDGPVALTMPTKLLSSPPMPGNGNVMMLNPVLSSPGEVVREVEIVMPTFKRRGRPVKKNR